MAHTPLTATVRTGNDRTIALIFLHSVHERVKILLRFCKQLLQLQLSCSAPCSAARKVQRNKANNCLHFAILFVCCISKQIGAFAKTHYSQTLQKITQPFLEQNFE